MKPNWQLRFHVYHIFGDYLNFHSAILAIAKLYLSIYYNETNLLRGNWTLTTKGLAHLNKGVSHPHIAQPWNPPPNFQTTNPNIQTKLARFLTYTIMQPKQKPPKLEIKFTIEPNISLSLPSIMRLHHHMEVRKCGIFLLNILTHKSKWVVS
jgi:hypothetical protein